MKLLIKLVVVLVVLLVLAVAGGLYFLDAIAAKAISAGGQRALGVETTVERAHVGLLAGVFTLSELKVANPPGYDAPHFMRLVEGETAIDLGTLRAEQVVLPHLTLTGLDMHLERSGGKANYAVITDNLKRFESGAGAGSGDADGKRYVIRELTVRDISVHVNLLPEAGEATRLDVPIPEIVLEDVGSSTDRGVLMGGLLDVLVQAVLAAVVERGGLPGELLADLQGRLQGLSGAGIDVLGQVRGQIDELGEQIEGIGERAGDILKGIGSGGS